MTGTALLYPECLLTALGLLVLVADWFVPREHKRDLAWVSIGGLLLALVATTLLMTSPSYRRVLPGWAESQISVDNFALFFKTIVLLGTILVLLACPDYVEKRIVHAPGEFYALLVFSALGMSLMAASKDLITLYLAMEFTSLTSYVLAGYQKKDRKSSEAGIKYFLLGVVSSGVMLYGMSLVYGVAGDTGLERIASQLKAGGAVSNPLLMPAVVLIITGFGFKMALAPFHMWCPDVYEGAPTPVAALLSVGPKAAGFAMMLRVFSQSFGVMEEQWAFVLALIAAVTMTVGNICALHQTNLKRLLAYSSVAQAGYMLIGVAAAGADPDWRASGTLFYLFSYAFMNIGAFVCAMVLLEGAGTEEVSDCANWIQRSPLVTICFVVFLLSLSGIPPTAGFWAKALVFGAAIDARLTWLGIIGWLNVVIAVFYYFNIVRYMFNFPPPQLREAELVETRLAPPMPLQFCLLACAAFTLLIGVHPDPFISLARNAGAALGG